MGGLFGQVGFGIDLGGLALLYFSLLFAGAAVALWMATLVLSGGRGPRLPRVRRLPRLVVRSLVVAAAVLWVVCGCGYAGGGSRSVVFRTALPFAVALTVAAVSVRAEPGAAADRGLNSE
jgi:hypothetical protein